MTQASIPPPVVKNFPTKFFIKSLSEGYFSLSDFCAYVCGIKDTDDVLRNRLFDNLKSQMRSSPEAKFKGIIIKTGNVGRRLSVKLCRYL